MRRPAALALAACLLGGCTLARAYAPGLPPTRDGFGDGTWLVPDEVRPGTYRGRSSGAVGDKCSWARLRSFDGAASSTIAGDLEGEGPVVVTIRRGDAGFRSRRCGPWERVAGR